MPLASFCLHMWRDTVRTGSYKLNIPNTNSIILLSSYTFRCLRIVKKLPIKPIPTPRVMATTII